MNDIKLSPIQQKIVNATDRARSVCVTASAGSGKTTVMLERLMAILERDDTVEMDHILAITFTDKAANNIKEKLRRLLEEKGRAAESAAARRRYGRCLRRLEDSYIGTIHAFASRVLKEHPLEAGVEPGFSIISDGMDGVLMDRVIDRLFGELAVRGNGLSREEKEKQFALLKEYETDRVRSALKDIYTKSRNYEVPPEKIIVRDRHEECARASDEVRRAVRLLAGKRATPSFASAMERAEKIASGIAPGGRLDIAAVEELTAAIKSIRLSKNTPAEIAEEVQRLKEVLLPDLALFYYEALSCESKAVFLNLFRSFAGLYEAEKRRDAVMDYDDLLWYTWLLFRSDDPIKAAVAERYRSRFRYIMVDEFQDTSRLQAGIVTALARGNNLFIVGDRKQSIYGFRNADPDLIRACGEEITKGGGDCIALEENYRSRPGLVRFVNFVFGETLAGEYREVSARSGCPEGHHWEHDIEILRVAKHEGEANGGENVDEETSETIGRELEARRLAARLKDLVEGKKLHVRYADGGRILHRPAGYRDIAILFRSMKDSHFYEDALERCGIPYYVIRGNRFFNRPEVRDCVNFLKLIDTPSLDIETAAVLKSPFIGLTDDALVLIRERQLAGRKGRAARGFFQAANDCAVSDDILKRFSAADRTKLKRFAEVSAQVLEKKDCWAISELLEFLVVSCSFDIASVGKRNGERRYANIKKLIEKAREFEKGKFFTLREFIRYIERMEVEEADEAEAQVELEEGGETVKLCTIHKAKGLEFPVVVLADLGREFPKTGQEFYSFSKEGELGLKVYDRKSGKAEKTKTVQECNERRKADEIDERKRIFYVAVTRARDYLILSGVSKGRDEEKLAASFREDGYVGFVSYMEWVEHIGMRIMAARAQGTDLGFECLYTPALAEPFRADESGYYREGPRLGFADPESSFEKYFGEKPDPQAKEEVAELFVRIAAGRAREIPVEMDFAVTPLLEYKVCPRRYFRLVELRESYPVETEEREEVSDDQEYPEQRLPRNRFGDLFHLVMQRFNFQVPDPEREAARLAGDLGLLPGSADSDELVNLVCAFSRHPVFQKIRQGFAQNRAHREVPFIVRDERGLMRGTIDLLFYDEGTGWTILDYKTNRDYPGMVREKTAHYGFQLLSYAHAVNSITGEAPQKLGLYFAVPREYVEVSIDQALLMKTAKELGALKKAIIAGNVDKGCGKEECPFCRT